MIRGDGGEQVTTSYQLPVASYQVMTSNRLKFFYNQLPVTNYQLPAKNGLLIHYYQHYH